MWNKIYSYDVSLFEFALEFAFCFALEFPLIMLFYIGWG